MTERRDLFKGIKLRAVACDALGRRFIFVSKMSTKLIHLSDILDVFGPTPTLMFIEAERETPKIYSHCVANGSKPLLITNFDSALRVLEGVEWAEE